MRGGVTSDVPLLVERVLKANDASAATQRRSLPLKGFAIGNGVMGDRVGDGRNRNGDLNSYYFNFEWFHGHGQLSEKTFRRTVQDCCGGDACSVATWGTHQPQSLCNTNWTREVAGYYQYNLYDTCNHSGGFRAKLSTATAAENYRRGRSGGLPAQLRGPLGGGTRQRTLPSALPNRAYPCGGGQAMNVYMSLPQVKAALHVPPDAVFFDSDGTYDILLARSTGRYFKKKR